MRGDISTDFTDVKKNNKILWKHITVINSSFTKLLKNEWDKFYGNPYSKFERNISSPTRQELI